MGSQQFSSLMSELSRDGHTIAKKWRLFLGLAMFVVGIFHFDSGRYCDGTVADYYSCTNPATYYYYSGITMGVLIIGAVLLALSFVRFRMEDADTKGTKGVREVRRTPRSVSSQGTNDVQV